jgi:hypothetical protein
VNAPSLREHIIAGLDLPATMLFDRKYATAEAQIQQRITTAATGHKVVVGAKRPNARLRVPMSSPKPDRFYKQVAAVYTQLAAHGNRPAADLAEANGVPLTTAHRWVREARRRGFLLRGQKGHSG